MKHGVQPPAAYLYVQSPTVMSNGAEIGSLTTRGRGELEHFGFYPVNWQKTKLWCEFYQVHAGFRLCTKPFKLCGRFIYESVFSLVTFGKIPLGYSFIENRYMCCKHHKDLLMIC